METLFLLIPLSLMLVVAIVGALWWAVGSGQYDDTPARDAVSRDGTA